MGKLFIGVIFVFFLALGFGRLSVAQMETANYKIPSSVLSGGILPMASNTFQINGTQGQVSSIKESTDSVDSQNYALYSGYWYTIWIKTKGKILPWLNILFGD